MDWEKYYALGLESRQIPDSAIGDLIGEVSLSAQRDFDAFDASLALADCTRLAPIIMVGVLRTSCVARNRLVHWQGLVDRSKEELDKRGKNTAELLQGLIPK